MEQNIQDFEVKIEKDYNLDNALEDFKKGLKQFQANQLDSAYFLLRKANYKFLCDNQIKLLLETNYIIATILTKKKKYKSALETFKELETLAIQIEHEK